ncbi:MAG: heme exporter protein CcmD [Actinomycetes bacterium]
MSDAGFVIASYALTAAVLVGYVARLVVRTRRAEAAERDR